MSVSVSGVSTRVKVEIEYADGTSRSIELRGTEASPVQMRLDIETDVREKPLVGTEERSWVEYEPTGYQTVKLEAFGRRFSEEAPA